MRLELLARAIEIPCPCEAKDMEVTGIATDSRTVAKGELFVCIRGIHADGHAYVGEAVQRGAVCILVDRYEQIPKNPPIPFLQCGDCRTAVSHLYRAFYGFPDREMKLIGVTGTNGKTTVTHMLRAILEADLHRCGLIGTVGCESVGRSLVLPSQNAFANLTTPDPRELYRILAEMKKDRVEYVIMEASSHALALEKLSPLRFEAAIFTNLTPEHLDFHGSMERYAAAKAKLFQKAKITVCNADAAYASYMQKHAAGKFVNCTMGSTSADYCAEEISLEGKAGVSYRLRSLRTRLRIASPIPGEFTVMNSMQAAVCALELGCSPAAIKTGLSSLGAVKGRMERVKLGVGAPFSAIIDYAHTPDALEKILQTAKELVPMGARIVLVFGCGGDRDRSKRARMGEIAARMADRIIITSDNSRSEDPMQIIHEICDGIQTKIAYDIIPERARAIRYAIETAEPNDLILLCGKGHETYELDAYGRHPFDEREIAAQAYRERLECEREEED